MKLKREIKEFNDSLKILKYKKSNLIYMDIYYQKYLKYKKKYLELKNNQDSGAILSKIAKIGLVVAAIGMSLLPAVSAISSNSTALAVYGQDVQLSDIGNSVEAVLPQAGAVLAGFAGYGLAGLGNRLLDYDANDFNRDVFSLEQNNYSVNQVELIDETGSDLVVVNRAVENLSEIETATQNGLQVVRRNLVRVRELPTFDQIYQSGPFRILRFNEEQLRAPLSDTNVALRQQTSTDVALRGEQSNQVAKISSQLKRSFQVYPEVQEVFGRLPTLARDPKIPKGVFSRFAAAAFTLAGINYLYSKINKDSLISKLQKQKREFNDVKSELLVAKRELEDVRKLLMKSVGENVITNLDKTELQKKIKEYNNAVAKLNLELDDLKQKKSEDDMETFKLKERFSNLRHATSRLANYLANEISMGGNFM